MRQTPLRSETFDGCELIERRVALVEDRAAVRDPILLRERRELVSGEGWDGLVIAGAAAAGEHHESSDSNARSTAMPVPESPGVTIW